MILKKLEEFLAALFNQKAEKAFTGLSLLWLIGLYLFCAVLWGYFWGWGRVPLDYHDWVNINIPRLDVVRDALIYFQLPLHVEDVTFLHGSSRFFALPDVITTPQMIFLKFISLENFVFFDILIHYTIGFVSLLWFRRRFDLSLVLFSLLVLLFNFNGYITLHYVAGHFTWAGYFLFPAFFILMAQFVEKTPDWQWVTKVSLLLFYAVLAGSEHHFVWLMLFLAILILVERKKFFWGATAILFGGLASAVRLIPPAVSASELSETTKGQLFAYDGPLKILQMLTTYRTPAETIIFPPGIFQMILDNQKRGGNIIYTVDFLFWEYALYIGMLATVMLIVFGIVMGCRSSAEPVLKKFSLPAILLLCLSISGTFDMLRITGFPFFVGERVSARMIAVPFVFLMIFAIVNFQRWLNASPPSIIQRFALLGGAGLILVNLLRFINQWQIKITRTAFGPLYLERPVASLAMLDNSNSLVTISDPVYSFALLLGTLITLASLGFLFYQSLKARRIDR